jgi:HEAT repeat protein/cyclophilin family peptidyl-prolyl cis-trans isomerase
MPHRSDRGSWIPARHGIVAALVILLSCAEAPPRSTREFRDEILEIVRREAARGPENLEFFRQATHAGNAAVRARAERALLRAAQGPEKKSQPFVTLLASDEDAGVRREAAFALGSIGDPAAAPFLKAGARDVEPTVRATSLAALSHVREVQAAWFSEMTLDPDPLVRIEAVLAAARLGDAALLVRLPEMLAVEKDERVRWTLYWAVARLGPLPPEMRRHLASAVKDPNWLVAVHALEGLRGPGGTEGAAEILAESQVEKRFWIVKEAAARTLAVYMARPGLDPVASASIQSFLASRRPRDQQPAFLFSAPGVIDAPPGLATMVPQLMSRGLRNPRAEVLIAGRGTILLELFVLDAPLHVAAFARLAREGRFNGRKVQSVDPLRGVLFCDPLARTSPDGLEGAALPEEMSPASIHRGALLSVGGRAGSVFVAHVPLPDVEGSATCWGKVALGMEVLDRVEADDSISGVTILDSTGLPIATEGATGS